MMFKKKRAPTLLHLLTNLLFVHTTRRAAAFHSRTIFIASARDEHWRAGVSCETPQVLAVTLKQTGRKTNISNIFTADCFQLLTRECAHAQWTSYRCGGERRLVLQVKSIMLGQVTCCDISEQ